MFTDGITNKLVGCFNKNEENNESIENVILIRVYGIFSIYYDFLSILILYIIIIGNKTDLLIDRSAETRNIILLHRYDIAPQLFAIFKNGLVYEFVPGVTLK